MDSIINITLIVFLTILFIILAFYSPRLLAWFGAIRPQKRIFNDKKNNIAVLIPARNESNVIEGILNALDKQTYPRENFEAFVIVKELNDPTIALVKKHGYKVHVASQQNRKGDALDSVLKMILKEYPNKFESYLIMDADCGMDDTFIEEMNNALASGAQIIGGKKIVKNYMMEDKKAVTLQGSCNGIIWTLIDEMGNRFKSDHGYTIMTVGTGIMIRHDVVEENNGWPYNQTLTEDIEFMNDIAVHGWSTYYYSYAKLYMEEAPTLKETNKRRRRWLTGVVDSTRLYASRLSKVSKTSEKRMNKFFVHGLNPVYLYIGLCVFFFLLCLATSAFMFFTGYPLWTKALLISLIPLGIIYVSFFFMTLFAIIIDNKYIKLSFIRKIVLLFVHPVFYMGYIPIIAKALLGLNSQEWEAIKRVDNANSPTNGK